MRRSHIRCMHIQANIHFPSSFFRVSSKRTTQQTERGKKNASFFTPENEKCLTVKQIEATFHLFLPINPRTSQNVLELNHLNSIILCVFFFFSSCSQIRTKKLRLQWFSGDAAGEKRDRIILQLKILCFILESE